jgi:Protein of unknown function (DUF3592)
MRPRSRCLTEEFPHRGHGGRGFLEMAKNSRQDARVGQWLVAVGLAVLGVALWVCRSRYGIWSSWPAAEGIVTRSELHRHASSRRGSSGKYTAHLQLQFEVAGKQFTASAQSDRAFMSKTIASRYAVGTRQTLRYNPENPNDILFPVHFMWLFGPPALGAVFGLSLTGIGFQWVRGAPRRRGGRGAPRS